MQMLNNTEILAIDNLGVRYSGCQVVNGISLSVHKGEIVGIVGESGSGKSTLLNTVAGLLPPTAEICSGSILCAGVDVLRSSRNEMRTLRKRKIGYIFQNAENSFDPLFTIGKQFDEALKARESTSNDKHDRITVIQTALQRVGLDDTDRILRALPSELSGGMCQRVALAIALAQGPEILLADEPTSALDRKSQEKIVNILKRLNDEDGLSVLIVSHDIDLIAAFAHNIVVMHNGQLIESGSSENVMAQPQHAYTRELIAAIPRNNDEIKITELGAQHAS